MLLSPWYKVSLEQCLLGTKSPWNNVSLGTMSPWNSVSLEQCLLGTMSPLEQCLLGTMSPWNKVSLEQCLLGTKSPWNSVPWNSVPWNNVTWNSVPWNNVPWNNVATPRILARVIRGWCNRGLDKTITNPEALTLIASEPTAVELDQARMLLLAHAMIDTARAYKEGRLDSLLPVIRGKLIVTTGRLGEQNMLRLFGVEYLPILMPSSRVAFLYMLLAQRC